AIGLLSTPIADIPKYCASYNIVPDPLYGSSKTDSLGNCSNMCFSLIGVILPLYEYISCIVFGLLTDLIASNFSSFLLFLFTMNFSSINDILPLYRYILCIDFRLLTDFKASNFYFLLLLLFTMNSALSLPIFDKFFHLLAF